MSPDTKIVERVRKLLNLADTDKNDSDHEAMRAMERAHMLMREYGIQMADLGDADDGSLEISVCIWKDAEKSQYDSWVSSLGMATSALFGIQGLLFRSGRRNRYRVRYAFVGEETDVELAKEVWPWLVKQGRKASRQYGGHGWTSEHRNFAEGFAARVYQRASQIAEASRQTAEESTACDDQKYALVIAAKQDALEMYMSEHFPHLKTNNRSARGEYDPHARGAGADAGDRVNLNFRSQVGSSSKEGRKLLK